MSEQRADPRQVRVILHVQAVAAINYPLIDTVDARVLRSVGGGVVVAGQGPGQDALLPPTCEALRTDMIPWGGR